MVEETFDVVESPNKGINQALMRRAFVEQQLVLLFKELSEQEVHYYANFTKEEMVRKLLDTHLKKIAEYFESVITNHESEITDLVSHIKEFVPTPTHIQPLPTPLTSSR